jgi:hypothetical protein
MANEFPPLGGTDSRSIPLSSGAGSSSTPGGQNGQGQNPRTRPPGTGVWNGNSLPPGVSGLPPRPNLANTGESQPVNIANVTRLEDADKKFERPPPKSGASLYDPRVQSAKSRSGSKDRLENAGGGVKGITQGVAALSVTVPATPTGARDDDQNQPKTPAAKASDGAMTNNENTTAATTTTGSPSAASESSGAATAGTGSLGNGQ